MKTLKVSDNNNTNTFGPFNNERDAVKERTQLISAYGYTKANGFTRENYPENNQVIFRHAVYSTVIFEITPA